MDDSFSELSCVICDSSTGEDKDMDTSRCLFAHARSEWNCEPGALFHGKVARKAFFFFTPLAQSISSISLCLPPVQLSKHEQAVAEFTNALRDDPSYTKAYEKRAASLYDLGELYAYYAIYAFCHLIMNGVGGTEL